MFTGCWSGRSQEEIADPVGQNHQSKESGYYWPATPATTTDKTAAPTAAAAATAPTASTTDATRRSATQLLSRGSAYR